MAANAVAAGRSRGASTGASLRSQFKQLRQSNSRKGSNRSGEICSRLPQQRHRTCATRSRVAITTRVARSQICQRNSTPSPRELAGSRPVSTASNQAKQAPDPRAIWSNALFHFCMAHSLRSLVAPRGGLWERKTCPARLPSSKGRASSRFLFRRTEPFPAPTGSCTVRSDERQSWTAQWSGQNRSWQISAQRNLMGADDEPFGRRADVRERVTRH